MVARSSRSLTWLFALSTAVLGMSGCSPEDTETLRAGDAIPIVNSQDSGSPFRLVWMVGPDAYLSCQSTVFGLRRIQQRVGGLLPVVVIHRGSKTRWFEEFRRQERIQASVVGIEEAVFNDRYGDSTKDRLILVRRETIVEVLPNPFNEKQADDFLERKNTIIQRVNSRRALWGDTSAFTTREEEL